MTLYAALVGSTSAIVAIIAVLGASRAVEASRRRARILHRLAKAPEALRPEIVPADAEVIAPLVVAPKAAEEAPPTFRTTRLATPLPVQPAAEADAAPRTLSDEQKSELMSLIETMQWGRALAVLEKHLQRSSDMSAIAALAEEAVLERLRALPASELQAQLGGYRVLALLAPANGVHASKLDQYRRAIAARRDAILGRLVRDEDRAEGITWFNSPNNVVYDDLRPTLWLYIGRRKDGLPWLQMRTNCVGETRLYVHAVEAFHDGMAESLIKSPFKRDPDTQAWEWHDVTADAYQIEVLRSLSVAQEAVVSFEGDQYFRDVTLTDEDKRGLREIIELYDLMRIGSGAPVAIRAPARQTSLESASL